MSVFLYRKLTRVTNLSVTTHPHSHAAETHSHPHADPEIESSSALRIQRLAMFLEAHFGEVELHMPDTSEEPEQGESDSEPLLLVQHDGAEAQISLISLVSKTLTYRCRDIDFFQTVNSSNEALRKRVEAVLDMAVTTVSSLAESFTSTTDVVAEDAGPVKEKSSTPLGDADVDAPENGE